VTLKKTIVTSEWEDDRSTKLSKSSIDVFLKCVISSLVTQKIITYLSKYPKLNELSKYCLFQCSNHLQHKTFQVNKNQLLRHIIVKD